MAKASVVLGDYRYTRVVLGDGSRAYERRLIDSPHDRPDTLTYDELYPEVQALFRDYDAQLRLDLEHSRANIHT